ncbi:hypothetical protein C8R44DRAFT_745801 [Mycena epipterygia]|nr:hypothetical protein C8R44DRAFT_745801 [Mycena epipterygia]
MKSPRTIVRKEGSPAESDSGALSEYAGPKFLPSACEYSLDRAEKAKDNGTGRDSGFWIVCGWMMCGAGDCQWNVVRRLRGPRRPSWAGSSAVARDLALQVLVTLREMIVDSAFVRVASKIGSELMTLELTSRTPGLDRHDEGSFGTVQRNQLRGSSPESPRLMHPVIFVNGHVLVIAKLATTDALTKDLEGLRES